MKKIVEWRSILILSVLLWSGCDLNMFEPELPFESCCEISAIVTTIGESDIYIPNAITPNDDHLNDQFAIFVSKPIRILSISVLEETGQLGIVRSNIDVTPSSPDIWVPRNASGNAVLGLYNYEMLIEDAQGIQDSVKGQFCAFSCDEVEQFSVSKCAFPTMHAGAGMLDPSLPSGETCP